MAEQETRNSPSLGGQGNGSIGGGGGGEDMKEDVNAPINIKVSWCGLVYFEWSFLLFSFLFYCFSSFTYSCQVVTSQGDETYFKIKRSTKLSKLQGAYASKVGKDVSSIRLVLWDAGFVFHLPWV